ncbi:hypothetical protein ACIB24_03125 [Spongisporangium articulatum]|uniref:Uncharacterized protein n=1 Tax=Spongisporangium articulatum TaxID=3362603 RepID=A0ABW8AI62_9ACTN
MSSRITAGTVTTLAALTLLPATPAAADVHGQSNTIKVVVDAPKETITLPIVTSASADGSHSATLWIHYPDDPVYTLAGATAGSGASVTLKATLDTRKITRWGALQADVVDDTDGSSTTIDLDVRRRSQAMLNHAEVRTAPSGCQVALGARVRHYSPAARDYVASKRSPVRFQEYTKGRWATAKTATTTDDGLSGATVTAAPGKHVYRAWRPDGATVWADASPAVRVVVPKTCA